MKIRLLLPAFVAVFALVSLNSCESRKPETQTSPTPQDFTPEELTDSLKPSPDSLVQQDGTQVDLKDTVAVPEVKPQEKRIPVPTVAELKKITPGQEAKRALSNDAMQIYKMQPEAFFKFMESRISYYRGKGNLKTENDRLRIEITEKEMLIETPKGRQTFSMQ